MVYDLYTIIKYVSSEPRSVVCAHRGLNKTCAVDHHLNSRHECTRSMSTIYT